MLFNDSFDTFGEPFEQVSVELLFVVWENWLGLFGWLFLKFAWDHFCDNSSIIFWLILALLLGRFLNESWDCLEMMTGLSVNFGAWSRSGNVPWVEHAGNQPCTVWGGVPPAGLCAYQQTALQRNWSAPANGQAEPRLLSYANEGPLRGTALGSSSKLHEYFFWRGEALSQKSDHVSLEKKQRAINLIIFVFRIF